MLQVIYVHIGSDPEPCQCKVIFYRIIRINLPEAGSNFKGGSHIRLPALGKPQFQTDLMHVGVQRNDQF